MKVELSDQLLDEVGRVARSCGLSETAWIEAVCFRIARNQGMPQGVMDPSHNDLPSYNDPLLRYLERLARAAELLALGGACADLDLIRLGPGARKRVLEKRVLELAQEICGPTSAWE